MRSEVAQQQIAMLKAEVELALEDQNESARNCIAAEQTKERAEMEYLHVVAGLKEAREALWEAYLILAESP